MRYVLHANASREGLVERLEAVLASQLFGIERRAAYGLIDELDRVREQLLLLGEELLVLGLHVDGAHEYLVAGVLERHEQVAEALEHDDLGLEYELDVLRIGSVLGLDRVAQELVGLVDLLEYLAAVRILVRMVLLRQLEVRPANLVLVRNRCRRDSILCFVSIPLLNCY